MIGMAAEIHQDDLSVQIAWSQLGLFVKPSHALSRNPLRIGAQLVAQKSIADHNTKLVVVAFLGRVRISALLRLARQGRCYRHHPQHAFAIDRETRMLQVQPSTF
jgi:hypothetical protein